MPPGSGTIMVFDARLGDCPVASVYGPKGQAADCNVAADCKKAAAAELGIVIGLESRVTAAVRAKSRPSTVAPVVTVMEANARMFPLNTEPVPNRSEEHTSELQS